MRMITAKSGICLNLGRQGENGAQSVVFDLSPFQTLYGSGTPRLLVRRASEDAPYIASITVQGTEAVWVIRAADSAIGGFGACELQWTVGETLAKSVVYETFVTPALTEPTDEVPAAAEDWVSSVMQAAQSVLDAAAAQKKTLKTQMDSVATVNTQYYLGTQSTVSIELPSSNITAGDLITCVFYSGSTATTLSITGTTIGDVVVPKANERIELNILYDGVNWAIVSNAMAVPPEVSE